MGIFRWPFPARDIPLPDLVDQLARFFKQSDAILVGGDRAHAAIDSSHTLQTAVGGNATIAGKPAGGVAAVFATEWMETFEVAPKDWVTVVGAPNYAIVGTGQTGGSALRQTGTLTLAFPWKVPYDASKLYRLRARVKRVSGAGQFTYGLRCLDVTGNVIATVAACVAGATPTLGSYGAEYTGWVKGYGAFGGSSTDASVPSPLPSGTVALQPYMTLNSGDGTGVMDVDYLDYDRMDEEASKRTYTSLIPSTDPRHASGARVVPNAVDSPAIQQDVSIVGRLQSITDPTVFVDFRTTLAPGSIIVSLPGYTADNLGNADYAGNLSAATGTFAGALVAATGTFAGDITAATGTFSGTVASTAFEATTATFKASVEIGRAGTGTGVLAIWNNNAAGWPLQLYTTGGGGPPLVSAVKAQNSSYLVLIASGATGIVLAGNDSASTSVPVSIYGSLYVTSSSGGTGNVSADTVTANGISSTGAVSGASASFSGAVSCNNVVLGSKPTLTYSRTGESAAAAQLRSALATLGFVIDSTVP